MSNLALYVLTVLIWGSTWLAIKYQLGEVAALVSIAHRFMLAAIVIWVLLLLRRQPLRLSLVDHGFIALQGLCLFCFNYVMIYAATAQLTSGLVAVVFSTMVIFNPLMSAALRGQPLRPKVLLGGALGLVGMVGVFLPELQALNLSDDSFRALLLCVVGTCSASLGNVVAARNVARRVPVLLSNAWGMTYGAGTLYLVALATGQAIVVEATPQYLLSLFYLALFGSVVAFWAYVTLIGNIGADKAAYSSLLFPVVALLLSTVVEGYHWSPPAIIGFALVLLGNAVVMRPDRPRPSTIQ